MPINSQRILIIGGGAAGYFAAITCAEADPNNEVIICETGKTPLAKVRVSGGGRCNVTYNCFDPARLIMGYPRGANELRGPFSRFHAGDTVTWFEERGVGLKVEEDGRIFPKSDDSKTITDCLENSAKRAGVKVWFQAKVMSVEKLAEPISGRAYQVRLEKGQIESFNKILLATGSASLGYKIAASLGHSICDPVPSLFTFEIKDQRLSDLSGISFLESNLELRCDTNITFRETGPLLITHWGLSGPAVIRLSAWAARELYLSDYKGLLEVNWIAQENFESVFSKFQKLKETQARRMIAGQKAVELPQRFWMRLLEAERIPADAVWANASKKTLQALAAQVTQAQFKIVGKGVFKDEFATCGGVKLSEIDFKKMESKILPGFYFAGEVLDIDGITGGYNFQCAWTTAWLAGKAMAI